MSYATLEVSQQDSAPVQLFQFNRGNTTWRYVALPALFTALTHDWTPEVISVGNISSSSDVPKDTISITLPITNAMAAAFLAYAPDAVTTVTVFRTHYDDPTNGLAIWKGRVLSVSVTVATVTLTCEPVFVSLRRLGLRETYQRSCRHIFGGQGCNVDREALKISRVVTSVVGAKVTGVRSLASIFKRATSHCSSMATVFASGYFFSSTVTASFLMVLSSLAFVRMKPSGEITTPQIASERPS